MDGRMNNDEAYANMDARCEMRGSLAETGHSIAQHSTK